MLSLRSSACLTVLILGTLASLDAQDCLVNISTGFDEETQTVVAEGSPELRYLVDDGLGILEPVTVDSAIGFPIPPWVANDANSLWISTVPDTNAAPGIYRYEILVDIPDEIDASGVSIEGRFAMDCSLAELLVNEEPTAAVGAGFGGLADLGASIGFGLFENGLNSIVFVVENGGDVANPSGLRVEACLVAAEVDERPYDISTGFVRAEGRRLEDGEASADWTLSSPTGEEPPAAVPEGDFPFPPWLPNTIQSRWIGPNVPPGEAEAGEFIYRTTVSLPGDFPIERAEILGGFAADDAILQFSVNGEPVDLPAHGLDRLTSFPAQAGRGLLVTGENELTFVVSNGVVGPTGLRVDAEIVEGAPDIDAPATLFTLDTGFDDTNGVTFANGEPDDHWVLVGPGGFGPAFATVGLGPVPPWAADTQLSRWIGTDQGGSNGDPGLWTFTTRVELPEGFNAAEASIVGVFSSDNPTVDILVNGNSIGVTGDGNFPALAPFPIGAGGGLFEVGVNEVSFVVENAGDTVNPVGLRVEAVVGLGLEDPRALQSGLGPRGIGPLPAGEADGSFVAEFDDGTTGSPLVIDPPEGWVEGPQGAQWIGTNTGARFVLRFLLPPELNVTRALLAGGFSSSTQVTTVLLNGTAIAELAEGDPTRFTQFDPEAQRGLFVAGENVLEFDGLASVDGAAVLLDAFVASRLEANPRDISTGFDQDDGLALDDGVLDDDWTLRDPFDVALDAQVLGAGVAPIPPWIADSETSRWIGASFAPGADPGDYLFERTVELTGAEAETARIEGFFAADCTVVDIRINEISIGEIPPNGFITPAYFPPDTGRDLFDAGQNLIEFVVNNGGLAGNPSGLRIDAVITTDGEVPSGDRFVRGDRDASGAINITDGIATLNFLFLGGPAGPCQKAEDADGSGTVNITDSIFVLNFLFLGGPPPPAPYPECGVDEDSPLDCGSFPPCL